MSSRETGLSPTSTDADAGNRVLSQNTDFAGITLVTLKVHSDSEWNTNRLSIVNPWLEAIFADGFECFFVQPMTEAAENRKMRG